MRKEVLSLQPARTEMNEEIDAGMIFEKNEGSKPWKV